MASRVHPLDIWDQDWFIQLDELYQRFYFYVRDKCSTAGIFRPNLEVFQKLFAHNRRLNPYNFLEAVNQDNERIIILSNGNWLLKSFIAERNPKGLKVTSRYHQVIITELLQNGAMEYVEGIPNLQEAYEDFLLIERIDKKKKMDRYRADPVVELAAMEDEEEKEETIKMLDPEGNELVINEVTAIQLPSVNGGGVMPVVNVFNDGSRIYREVVKFLNAENFELVKHSFQLANNLALKNILEAFCKHALLKGKSKMPSELNLSEWFSNWYNKLKKDNPIELDKLLKKIVPSPRMVPINRRIQIDKPLHPPNTS